MEGQAAVMRASWILIVITFLGVLGGCAQPEPPVVAVIPPVEPVPPPQTQRQQLLGVIDNQLPLPETRFDFKGAPMVIGILAPVQRAPEVAEAVRYGAILGLSEVVNRLPIELRFYDTGTTPQTAAAAYRQTRDDQAKVIIGPVFAENVRRVRDQIRLQSQAERPVLFSLSSDPRLVAPNVVSAAYDWQGMIEQLVKIVHEADKQRVAVVYEDNNLGKLLATYLYNASRRRNNSRFTGFYPISEQPQALRQTVSMVTEFPARQVSLERYRQDLLDQGSDLNSPEVSVQVAGLRRQHQIDGMVVLSSSLTVLQKLHSELEYAEVLPGAIQIFGISQWQELTELLPLPLYEQTLLPVLSPRHLQQASLHFNQVYRKQPSMIALQVYDLVRLVAMTSTSSTFEASRLFAQQGVVGSLGLFRFRPNRTIERRYAIGQISRGQMTLVRAMPLKFQVTNASIDNDAGEPELKVPTVMVEPIPRVVTTE